MKASLSIRPRALASIVVFIAFAALASCGGDVGSGGTGASLAGYSIGTVNGFGSVIVDNVSYDDLHAAVLAETAPGVDSPAEVRLGERVSVSYTESGIAHDIRILTAHSGTVTTLPVNGRFTMLGQTVVINGAGGSGPTTQFGGGYLRASDIAVGDPIDVNGILVQQAGAWVLAATRIDKLAVAPEYLRVTGVVAGLATSSTNFTLGALAVDASTAVRVGDTSMLANGQAVTLLALPATYVSSGANAPRVRAAQVRIASLQESTLDSFLSGSISVLDTVAKTFQLGAQRVSYAGATFSPAGATASNGRYVQIQGKVGSDAVLVATTVSVRSSEEEDDSELSGTIVAFDSLANRFTLREVVVDASSATLQNCPAGGLANGLYVQVTAALASNGVLATTIHCGSEPPGGRIEREGRASTVDAVASTFLLTSDRGALLTVQWTDTTFFGSGLTPATLSGKSVDVQGSLVGAVLVATKVKVND